MQHGGHQETDMPLNLKLDAKKVESIDQAVKDYQSGSPEVEARVLGWIRELHQRGATQGEVARFFQDRSIPLPRRWLRDAFRRIKAEPPAPRSAQQTNGETGDSSGTQNATNGASGAAADASHAVAGARARRAGDEEIE